MITLVCTTYNAEQGLRAWCESVKNQTLKPDRVIVVDGGSTDNTLSILKEYRFTVAYRPDLNIKYHKSPVAAGRNAAIRLASEGIICVTDAGCVLSLMWVEKITEAFRDEMVDIVGGSYVGVSTNGISERVNRFLSRGHLQQTEFSSRSLAFRREVWKDVGGYPEVYLTGEDTLFNQAIKKYVSTFSSGALVYWNCPATLKTFAHLQYRYALGDGISRLRMSSYAKIVGKYVFFAILALTFWPGALLGAIVFFWKRDIPIKIVSDAVKTAGYIVGLTQGGTSKH
jgi:glycosyltransferase involved in cell wall biosynthesis